MTADERDDRDDQLGGVAERRVQKTAERRTRSRGELFGAEADDAGQRHERDRRRDEHPRRLRQHGIDDPTDRRGNREEVQPIVEERAQHHSPNVSTSSSSAPGSKSKNASRL